MKLFALMMILFLASTSVAFAQADTETEVYEDVLPTSGEVAKGKIYTGMTPQASKTNPAKLTQFHYLERLQPIYDNYGTYYMLGMWERPVYLTAQQTGSTVYRTKLATVESMTAEKDVVPPLYLLTVPYSIGSSYRWIPIQKSMTWWQRKALSDKAAQGPFEYTGNPWFYSYSHNEARILSPREYNRQLSLVAE
ncbi:hypothetical protein J4457_03650 [Candidatus Woesearchaeota archaeon]|nr:hypothetical protein [Candidatus Woesearchaeota archaeon]